MFVLLRQGRTLVNLAIVISLVMSLGLAAVAQAQEPQQDQGQPNKAFLPLIDTGTAGAQAVDLEQLALQTVTARYQLSLDDLVIVDVTTTEAAALGVAAQLFTLMDNRDETVYKIAFDPSGQELDVAQVEATTPVVADAPVDGLAAQALAYVGAQQGIPSQQLVIAAQAAAQLPLTGVNLADFKVRTPDGRLVSVSFDQATGQVTDAVVAASQERAARTARYGAVEPALFDRLQSNTAEAVPVAIWLKLADASSATMVDASSATRGSRAHLEALDARVQATQGSFVQAVRGRGRALQAVTFTQAKLAPVLFAQLNAEQVNELARDPQVAAIQALPNNLGRHTDDSATTERYPFIWPIASGTAITVAIHEDDGVDTANPFLKNPVYWCNGVGTGPGAAACTVGRNIDTHATNVAGVIASTHNWRRGGAFGINPLLSANFQSFANVDAPKIVNSAGWAIDNFARVVNMSWGGCSDGGQDFFSRWADFMVKFTGVPIVISAGNRQCLDFLSDPDFVASPSLGWNTISVGSYFDNNTGLRPGDVLSSFSSYKNPIDPNSGRSYEKPDVVAMGGQVANNKCFGVETTGVGANAGANDSTCGTSFSAPDVTALTALVMGKDMNLLFRGEAVKAIMMAGATRNIIDGVNYADCPTSPTPGDCQDGAGAIDAYQTIQNIVVPGNWRHNSVPITPASFDVNNRIIYTATLTAGRRVRVAIAWDSTAVCSDLGAANQACPTDVLNADLDLGIERPGGTIIAISASFQNSAEVVDFTAPVTGIYKIIIENARFDAGTDTYLGVAWNPNIVDTRTPVIGVTTVTPNTTRVNQTTDMGRSFWDTYTGTAAGCNAFLSNETGLEKIYQVTTTATGAISAALTNIVNTRGVNSDIDVIILKKSGAVNSQNGQTIACGDLSATASSQPPGTYYIVVDGFDGSVAKFDLTVNFTSGSLRSLPEPLPAR